MKKSFLERARPYFIVMAIANIIVNLGLIVYALFFKGTFSWLPVMNLTMAIVLAIDLRAQVKRRNSVQENQGQKKVRQSPGPY